ncbi:uncharacterized protein LOC119371036 [Jatropha curcas]|uniref:uncharacterized protein LOC119371036 n=1 Tax=Jatropha curcas TaxID=180498 RepID=UPI0018932B3C|nr:uncharacterized protein LOC119371036 [Jatropha curcas]
MVRKVPSKNSNMLKKEPSEVVCYECNKPGHIKPNCPKLKRKSKKEKPKQAFVAAWSDSDVSNSESQSDEEESANIYLMTTINSDSKKISTLTSTQKAESNETNATGQKREESNVCLRGELKTEMWYMDSACFRHMTGTKEKKNSIDPEEETEKEEAVEVEEASDIDTEKLELSEEEKEIEVKAKKESEFLTAQRSSAGQNRKRTH